MIDGNVISGAFSRAGEIGHLPVSTKNLLPEDDRPPSKVLRLPEWDPPRDCSCGGSGHLEQYCSAQAIIDRLEARLAIARGDAEPPTHRGYNARGAEIHEHAEDAGVRFVIRETGVLLARALSAPVLMLNPERVVISAFPHHSDLAQTVAVDLNHIEHRRGIAHDQRPRVVAGTAPEADGDWMTALGAAAHAIEQQRDHIRTNCDRLAPSGERQRPS
jgi:predicted NBD/HSP70 family sugar kinase